jgi:hypothetical protein
MLQEAMPLLGVTRMDSKLSVTPRARLSIPDDTDTNVNVLATVDFEARKTDAQPLHQAIDSEFELHIPAECDTKYRSVVVRLCVSRARRRRGKRRLNGSRDNPTDLGNDIFSDSFIHGRH